MNMPGLEQRKGGMTQENADALRAPFPKEQIGKLPKAGITLDYVGHAATTDRLLQVDPAWTWRPMAYGPNGEPLMTNGGMWIWLTVCGVTRPGFGDGKNPKEIIGDAIRNAAMRFGVALDLWAKEDLQGSAGEPKADSDEATKPAPPRRSSSVSQAADSEPASPAEASPSTSPFAAPPMTDKIKGEILTLIDECAALRGVSAEKVSAAVNYSDTLTLPQAGELVQKLRRHKENLTKDAA